MKEMDGQKMYIARFSAIRGIAVTVSAIIILIAALIFFALGFTAVAVVGFTVAAILAIAGVIHIFGAKSRKIIVYEKTVKEKRGILNARKKNYDLTEIANVSVEQNFFGKLFDYGDIVIAKKGKSQTFSAQGIAKPFELKNYIQGLLDKS